MWQCDTKKYRRPKVSREMKSWRSCKNAISTATASGWLIMRQTRPSEVNVAQSFFLKLTSMACSELPSSFLGKYWSYICLKKPTLFRFETFFWSRTILGHCSYSLASLAAVVVEVFVGDCGSISCSCYGIPGQLIQSPSTNVYPSDALT